MYYAHPYFLYLVQFFCSMLYVESQTHFYTITLFYLAHNENFASLCSLAVRCEHTASRLETDTIVALRTTETIVVFLY